LVRPHITCFGGRGLVTDEAAGWRPWRQRPDRADL